MGKYLTSIFCQWTWAPHFLYHIGWQACICFLESFRTSRLLIVHKLIFQCYSNWMKHSISLWIVTQSIFLALTTKPYYFWIKVNQLVHNDLYSLLKGYVLWILLFLFVNFNYFCSDEHLSIIETSLERYQASNLKLLINGHYPFFRNLNFKLVGDPAYFCAEDGL
jgi:hypothetical protein